MTKRDLEVVGLVVLSVIFAAVIGPFGHAGDPPGQSEEKTVLLSEVPPAVRATVDQWAAVSPIRGIELGYKNGHRRN